LKPLWNIWCQRGSRWATAAVGDLLAGRRVVALHRVIPAVWSYSATAGIHSRVRCGVGRSMVGDPHFPGRRLRLHGLCAGCRSAFAGDGAINRTGLHSRAVAGFTSILLGRMANVLDRIRSLNEIAGNDTARPHLKSDIPRLRQRVRLLNGATHLALASGICTALLLVVGFATAYVGVRHEYGAGLLFAIAIGLLGVALSRFGQEVRLGLSEADHYR
jgi:Protein of unknown function (DUF2721)